MSPTVGINNLLHRKAISQTPIRIGLLLNCIAPWLQTMTFFIRFSLLLLMAGIANAAIIPLSATRSIRAFGVGHDGTAYDQSKSPSQEFGVFDEAVHGDAELVTSSASQRSSIRHDGIDVISRVNAMTHGTDVLASSPGLAGFESVFQITFTVDSPTPFTLESYIDNGAGAGIRYSFSGSDSGLLASYSGGFDPSVGNIIFISGVLTAQTYTLIMDAGVLETLDNGLDRQATGFSRVSPDIS